MCKKRVTLIDPSNDLTSVTVDASGINHDNERRKLVLYFCSFSNKSLFHSFFFSFRQKALKALSEEMNKTDRPRVVGAVIPQRSLLSSPKKKNDNPTSAGDSSSISTTPHESEPLISNEQK